MVGLSRQTRRQPISQVLDQIEQEYGGRPALAEDLVHLEEDGAKRLVQLMADPKRAGHSLLRLCADANLAPSSLLGLLKQAAVARALVQSHLEIAARLPAVVGQVIDAAEGRFVHCPCTVGGTIDPLPTCPKCRGQGQQYYLGSLEHQRMVLDMAELIPRPGGPVVNVQTNVGVSVAGSSFFDQVVKGFGPAMHQIDTPDRGSLPATSLALRDDDDYLDAVDRS